MPLSEFTFTLVVLLGIAMLVTGLCRKLPIPFTVVFVLIGVLLSNLADSWVLLSPLQEFEPSPEVMLFMFLPALIFESSFALDALILTRHFGVSHSCHANVNGNSWIWCVDGL